MLGKIWKKLLLIVLIIACLWNIVNKIVHIISFDGAINKAKAEIEEKNEKNTK